MCMIMIVMIIVTMIMMIMTIIMIVIDKARHDGDTILLISTWEKNSSWCLTVPEKRYHS